MTHARNCDGECRSVQGIVIGDFGVPWVPGRGGCRWL